MPLKEVEEDGKKAIEIQSRWIFSQKIFYNSYAYNNEQ
jgi:hypothetical protein